jgi:hypothetical protein
MAQQGHPWFIVLFHRLPDGSDRIYAKHFWQDLITKSVEAIRVADLAGEKLNQKELSITFADEDEHSGDLIRWIEATINHVGPDYLQSKRALYASIGFEDGAAKITFKIHGKTEDEIAKGLLGLGPGLKITDFDLRPIRFGLADLRQQLRMSTATLIVTQPPAIPCTLRIRPEHSPEPFSVPAKATFLQEPKRYARFSSDYLEIVWSMSDNKVDFSGSLKTDAHRRISALETYVRLLDALTRKRADVQVWMNGGRRHGGKTTPTNVQDDRWDKLHTLVRFLHSLAPEDPELSIAEVVDAWREVEVLRELVATDGVQCTLEFESLVAVPFGAERLLYYAHLTVGGQTFFALVERTVLNEIREKEYRRYELGNPHLLESYAVSGERNDTQFQADFERELNQSAVRTLGLADVKAAVEGGDIGVYTSPGFEVIAGPLSE